MDELGMPDRLEGQLLPPAKRSRKGWWIAAAAAGVLMVGGATAGTVLYLDHRAEEREERAEARREAEQMAEREAEREKERREREAERAAEEQRQYDACVAETEPLLDLLSEVDARLDVGMDLDEYSDKVGDASVAYDRIDVGELSDDCVMAVGVHLETALGGCRTTDRQGQERSRQA